MSPSVILVDAAAAESFLATFGRIQFVDWLELHVRVWEENDLRYPVSLMHFKRMFTHVSEDYADFATIIGIDYSGRVHHGDVVFQRQSRTWADQSDISGWNSQSHARMHERLTARADDRVLIASEVCSTIVRVSVTDVIGFAADMHLVSELFEAIIRMIVIPANASSGIHMGASTHIHGYGNWPPIFRSANMPDNSRRISVQSMLTRIISPPCRK